MNVLLGLKLTSYKNMITDVKSIVKVSSVTNLRIITDYKYKYEVDGVKYHYLPDNISKIPIIRFLYRIPLMIFACKKYNIDVLIGYHLASYGLAGFIVSRLLNIPISMHFLGNDLDNFCKKKYIGWLFLWVASKMDKLTVQGSNSRQFLEQKGIKNVAIIPTVCDMEQFQSENIFKEFDLIFIGRLSKEKRPDRFIEIVRLIKKKKDSIKAVILGSGPLEEELKKEIRVNNLEDNIYLAGWQDNIKSYLNKSKIFILTSDYDQLPLALLEAMASSLVPVAANVGNISDVVDYQNGYILAKDNLDSFADAVIELLDNENIYCKKSQAALQKIKSKYSIPSNTKRWENIISEITDK